MPLQVTRRRLAVTACVTLAVLAAAGWFASRYFSFDARFARSKAALDAYAAQVMATDPSTPVTPPPHVGAFVASDGIRLPRGFLFRSDYGHPLDWNGLAYSIQPLPGELADPQPPFEKMFFKPIDGNWYTVWRN